MSFWDKGRDYLVALEPGGGKYDLTFGGLNGLSIVLKINILD